MLVAVLLVTLLTAMVAASLLFRTHAEVAASHAASEGDQAWSAAMAGVQLAMAALAPGGSEDADRNEPAEVFTRLGDRALWYDNPELFRDRLVLDDGANRWYFTVYARNDRDPKAVRHGLSDEAGKISLNVASKDTLLKLPGMTAELVDALLDWRDADAESRTNGAEQEYYDTLPTPYVAKNGPVATVEELLLIKGFDARVVFGEDANLNGLLEPHEDDGEERFPADDRDGVLDAGLIDAVTAISYGPNVDAQGQPLLNLNGSTRELRELGLSRDTLDFIESYRGDGGTFTHPSQLLSMTHTKRERSGGRSRVPFAPPTRGGKGTPTPPRDAPTPEPVVLRANPTPEDLALLMGKTSTLRGRAWIGLVNVNSAPAATLAALPGLDESLAQRIVEVRRDLDAQQLESTAWLYTQGVLSAEQYKKVAPLLSFRGYQYRARVMGYGVPCGRFRVLEAVIDVASGTPRLVYLRELTRLGLPLTPSPRDPNEPVSSDASGSGSRSNPASTPAPSAR